MAAPTLQAQGTINAVTTGNLSLTLPAYTTNDIIVIQTQFWGPNSATVTLSNPSLGTPYVGFNNTASSGSFIYGLTTDDEIFNAWWARATSASSLGTTASITRGSNWDTGNDTCFAGRAYVIRGCDPNGSPFDYIPDFTPPDTIANPQLPAVTVGGIERLIIHFMAKSDNTTLPTAATGYTVGTVATTTTGTDAGFQTYRRTADANVTAVTPTGGAANAATNGTSTYMSVAFRPNNPRRFLIT